MTCAQCAGSATYWTPRLPGILLRARGSAQTQYDAAKGTPRGRGGDVPGLIEKSSADVETFDPVLVQEIDTYIEKLFVPPDEALEAALRDAEAEQLPAIHVSPNQGKLLYLLARLAGARRILEIGALGGYSTIWLAKALPAGGRVITLEIDPKHAEIARRNLARAVPDVRTEVRVGNAAALLEQMIAARDAPFDLVFIDADKPAYRQYLELALQLSRSGTVILADNLIRHGRVLEPTPDDENVRGAKAYNEAIASHPRLESIVLPIIRDTIDGLSLSIVR